MLKWFLFSDCRSSTESKREETQIVDMHFKICILLFMYIFVTCLPASAASSGVLVIGDTRLLPVNQAISGIEEVLDKDIMIVTPDKVKENLSALVRKHSIKTVIALGQGPMNDALSLPESITLLYGLVIKPPVNARSNTTGLYMGTPVKEYVNLISSFLPQLKKIGVIASPELLNLLDKNKHSLLRTYTANSSNDFVDTVNSLESTDALLLLPDIAILTQTAIEESYLYSFRNKVPLLGISKKHVRKGSLFALEFDPVSVGKSLGEIAARAEKENGIQQEPAKPSRRFDLYINRETAKKMKINIPEEMIRIAKQVYP